MDKAGLTGTTVKLFMKVNLKMADDMVSEFRFNDTNMRECGKMIRSTAQLS